MVLIDKSENNRKYAALMTRIELPLNTGGGIFFASSLININMEKRVLGIILSLVGVIGLIMAGVNFMNGSGTRDLKQIVVYGVLGAIFFFAGIGLIRNTRDRPS